MSLPKSSSELSGLPDKANKKEVFVIDVNKGSAVVIPSRGDGFGAAFSDAFRPMWLDDVPLHLHDWGGVIAEAVDAGRVNLCPNLEFHIVFSFTPWNAKGKEELPKMIEFARSAGFVAMIIMTSKEGKGGKSDTFSYLRQQRPSAKITYYEDTYSVIIEESEKTAGVTDGSIAGYLEIWQDPSGVRPSTTPGRAPNEAANTTDLERLNEHFAGNSYLRSQSCASLEDYSQCTQISELYVALERYPHLQRWHAHVCRLMALYGDFDWRGRPLASASASQL